jgi:hypothetical protein
VNSFAEVTTGLYPMSAMMTAMSVAVSMAAVVEMPVAMVTPTAVAVTPTVAVAPVAPSVAAAPAPAASAPAVGTPAADPAGLFDRALIVDDASRDARGQRRGLRGRQTRAGGENESGGGRDRNNEAIHGKSSCCIGTSLQLSVTALDGLGRTVAIPAAGLAAASAKPSRPPKNAGFDLNAA